MKSTIQNTIGQVLNLAQTIGNGATYKQQEFIQSYLMDIQENKGRQAQAEALFAMADPQFKFDWKEIYSSLTNDDDEKDLGDIERDAAAKHEHAWRSGKFPVQILDEDLVSNVETLDTLRNYIARVGNVNVAFVDYEIKPTQNNAKFLTYRQGAGISSSLTRNQAKHARDFAHGHFELSGCATPAELFAYTNCGTRWARTMIEIFRKALKKNRFSATVIPFIENFVDVLGRLKKVEVREGEGFELRLISSDLASQLTSAVDALDALAISEIREVMIRYDVINPLRDTASRKAKRHIKEHGAVLSVELLKCVIKSMDMEGESDNDYWENIAQLDVVGIARIYVRKMHLIPDDVALDANWLALDTAN